MSKSNKDIPNELKLLNEWRKRLGLEDWLIILRTDCKKDDLTLDYADGEVQYEEVSKSAEIRIVKECFCNAFRPFDFEEILVHELLHLKFSLIAEGEDWENSLQLRTLHQIIDDLARTLVSVKREYLKKTTESKK